MQLGLGNYLQENGYKKSSTLIREHCDRVLAICKKLDLKPMMWSDMYITSNTGGGYYEVPENADCSTWEKPDPDLEWCTGITTMQIRSVRKNASRFMNSFLQTPFSPEAAGSERHCAKLFQKLHMYESSTAGM